MIMMMKRKDNCYDLLMQTEVLAKFAIVSELTQKDYDFMLEHFRRIRNCGEEKAKEYGNACYYFPQSKYTPEVRVMLYNRDADDYVIKINLGQKIVSEMVGVELDMMIFELECLPNHRIGTPVYFPPPKEGSNL